MLMQVWVSLLYKSQGMSDGSVIYRVITLHRVERYTIPLSDLGMTNRSAVTVREWADGLAKYIILSQM